MATFYFLEGLANVYTDMQVRDPLLCIILLVYMYCNSMSATKEALAT